MFDVVKSASSHSSLKLQGGLLGQTTQAGFKGALVPRQVLFKQSLPFRQVLLSGRVFSDPEFLPRAPLFFSHQKAVSLWRFPGRVREPEIAEMHMALLSCKAQRARGQNPTPCAVCFFMCMFLFFFFLRFYLFIFRAGKGERNTNVWLPWVCPRMGARPTILACALGWESNQ